MTYLIEADDLVATVPGTLTLKEFDRDLIQQCLISTLLAPEDYTIAQILAEDWGHDARQVLGLGVKHVSGLHSKTGGKVIKNVSGYDLSKIYLGSCESLAKIETASLRLEKLPSLICELSLKLERELDLDLIVFLHKIATMDFDESFELVINLAGQLNVSFTATSEELIALKQSRLARRLEEFVASELDLDFVIKPYEKQYLSTGLRIEVHGVLTSLLNTAKSLGQSCQIYPKRGYLLLESSVQNLKKLDDCYYYIYPKTEENKKLETQLNDTDNAELDLFKQLQKDFV